MKAVIGQLLNNQVLINKIDIGLEDSMNNGSGQTIPQESRLVPERPSVYYRRQHPEYYSDSETIYEVPLTEELFDLQMGLLSTKKMQCAFENFALKTAMRLITPNIKPQTGPDGGGDGKVDAETYEVATDISSRWYVTEPCVGSNEKWAFAISCKKQWKQKVEHDVQNIIATNRGYTRILFFSNQYIKADVRIATEETLYKKTGVKVEIFDCSWFKSAVFEKGCRDVALSELGFSEEYAKCTKRIGPLDQQRIARLDQIEIEARRPINEFDPEYVDALTEACVICRDLGRSKPEIEGRFRVAFDACELHGSKQQKFNLIYTHAWTSYFWFEDAETTYKDFLALKPFLEEDCTVFRLERVLNLISVLRTAAGFGYIDTVKAQNAVDYVHTLEIELSKNALRPSCYLFIRIYILTQRLAIHAGSKAPISEDLELLKPLLLKAAKCMEISFEAQYDVMNMLSGLIEPNQEFDTLVDEMANTIAEHRSEVEAARVRMSRAIYYINNHSWKEAVRQLSFCVYAFEKEECTEELIKSSGMLGAALWEMKLPFSAEAFLLKAVCFRLKEFHKSGILPNLLVSTILKICEIELMLGRLVMYLNWYMLLKNLVHGSSHEANVNFLETEHTYDAAWTCRFAVANLSNRYIQLMPSLLDRVGLFFSSQYLKYKLGYESECHKEFVGMMQDGKNESWFVAQPVFEQFIGDLNISQGDFAHIQTTAANFTFHVDYPNVYAIQQIAEILAASMEALLATCEIFEVVPMCPLIYIHIEQTEHETELIAEPELDKYKLIVNSGKLSDDVFWEVISKLICYVFVRNAATSQEMTEWLDSKQHGEKMMDRVGVLLHTRMAMSGIWGSALLHRIESWIANSDKQYTPTRKLEKGVEINYRNKAQIHGSVHRINSDIRLWDEARWIGCSFMSDGISPPILALTFEKPEKGLEIIREWKEKIAEGSPSVKIIILKGINAEHPNWYRVNISPEGMFSDMAAGEYAFGASGRQTIEANTNAHLNFFEQELKRFGSCFIASCGFTDKINPKPCQISERVPFSNVTIKNAWEVRQGDIECLALQKGDTPYIPNEVKNNVEVMNILRQLEEGKIDMNRNDGSSK